MQREALLGYRLRQLARHFSNRAIGERYGVHRNTVCAYTHGIGEDEFREGPRDT